MSPVPDARVLLVGLMASGKSTVGQALGVLTGWPCLDNDALLLRSTGCTAQQLERRDGVATLHAAESDVLTLTLAMPPPLIAGVAAAAVLEPENRRRMHAGGHVVWLRPSVRTLARRVSQSTDGHRPLLGGDVLGTLTAMAAERDPLYAEVAHQVLDVDVLVAPQAAREILKALEATTG